MNRIALILLISISKNTIFAQNSTLLNHRELSELQFSDTLWLKDQNGIKTNHFLLLTENPYIWENTPQQNCFKNYYFKVGSEGLEIKRAFTGDPHFFDKYPLGILLKDTIYSFTIRFHFLDRYGNYLKVMGFEFNTGELAFFTFKGNIVLKEE